MDPGPEKRLDTARETLDAAYGAITELVSGLTVADLHRPTRCAGWTIADLLYHLLLDAQRALVALATPHPGPPTRDRVSYWRGYAGSDPEHAAKSAEFVRVSSRAHGSPKTVVARWTETAAAATVLATRTSGTVATQGITLSVPDFLDTLTTEAVIHHLDLTQDLPAPPEPRANPTAVTLATLESLAAAPLPSSWPAPEKILKLTGRLPLTTTDHATLGALAAHVPLLA